jgi:hypothetical protein
MKKPHLVIVGRDGVPLWGHCSSCEDVKFSPKDIRKHITEQEAGMRADFDQHFVRVHMRENASQAAARIVRQETED